MDLTKISNSELLVRLEKLAKTERKITHLVLWHINEMESRKLYADLGFGSMYEYLTKHLGYGESSAYRRIQSARLLKQIPHLAAKLEDGSLNLTQLTQVQKCLKEEKKAGVSVSLEKASEILEKIENKSNFETQKFLAMEFNQPIQMHEVVKPQRDQSVRLELTVSLEQMERWNQVKDLLSHSLPDGSWVEVMDYLAEAHLKRVLGKTQPDKEKQGLRSERSTRGFFTKQKRKYITLKVRRELLQKASHCCEYVEPVSGKKCESHYQLQIDHCVPLACGGEDDQNNLRVLCRTHNLLCAKQWGLSKIFSKEKKSARL
ncbi:MAG: HNH endonuclease [Bdellovibrionales bacterium]|nr:HNH endonuclease [Bdellovibrionales bacterium]